MSLSRVRRVLRRRAPAGLVSFRYLLPRLPPERRAHRTLLLGAVPDAPRPLAWLATAWHWLRWVSFDAWRATRRTVARHGPRVAAGGGASLRHQRREVLWLALATGLRPLDYYRFAFHDSDRRRAMWSYVFDAEAAAFHRGRDPVDSDGTGRRLLHDKVDAAAALAAAGVPVAETIHLLRAGSGRSDLAAIVADGDEVFCKPRRGSAARGVFGAVRNGDRIETWSLAGRPGDDHPDADDSPEPDDLMAADDYVVQRFYRNHPDIARLGAAHVAPATIRAITEFDPAGGDADLRWAFLEVPIRVQRDGREVGGHVHVAIDVGSGRLGEWARTLHADVDAEAAAVAAHCAGMTVPDWQLLRDVVRRAHLCVADVFSVAWDVVPTPDGPVVLEGNTTWSVIVPQQMHGPFLPS